MSMYMPSSTFDIYYRQYSYGTIRDLPGLCVSLLSINPKDNDLN